MTLERVVNHYYSIIRGGDSDTIGAICGSLAGSIYGESAIPERWKSALDPKISEQMMRLSALAVEKEKWETKKLYQMKPFPIRKISKNREVAERIFKLHMVFLACEVTTYPEIFQRIAYSSYKMFQRDLKALLEAQLVDIMYDKKRGGYVHLDEWGKFLGLDEKNQENYKLIFYHHVENPNQTIAQVYRLVDLLWYYPEDKLPDMSDLLYHDGNEDETLYKNKIKVPSHSPFITDYLQEHPELSIQEIYEDMETFIRLGEEFDFETEVRSFREEVEEFQKEFMPVKLYWDTGEPIDQNSTWDTPYFICDWWFWQGSPCQLSEGTIPKEQWVKVRGHDWDKE
ncbi:MAG: ADP-ribosylglycohydrolase family protein [Eubacteriales bacterium]